MWNPSFCHVQKLGQFMYFNIVDKINQEIDNFDLSINGGEYQVHKNTISKKDCNKLIRKLWSRIFNVGASRHSLRLLKDKIDLHPANFLKCRSGDGLIDHVTVIDKAVNDTLNENGTLVFDHGQEYFVELQIIQEHLEALLGCKCWIQCYVTKSKDTAFGIHSDDHPFLIIQLNGRKRWLHDNSSTKGKARSLSEIIYEPGDIAFYPRGKPHNVYGTGDLSVHLTVAFDGFDGKLIEDIPLNQRLKKIIPRIGTSLPYSINEDLVDQYTSVRMAYSCLPPIITREDGFALVETKYNTVKLSKDFVTVIKWLRMRRSTSAQDIHENFGHEIDRCVGFIRFGLGNNLLISALGE